MNKKLYIISTSFEKHTGGLIWAHELAAYAKTTYRDAIIIDLSKKSRLLENNKYIGMFYYFVYFLLKKNFFIFIDHRLHLRFNLALTASRFLKRGNYAAICHHILYKTKKNIMRNTIERLSEKLLLHAAQKIIVPSRSTAEEVMRLNGDTRKIVVINPTCTYQGQTLPKRECKNNLLFVGNLEERKGIDILLKALNNIDNMDFKLNIIGSIKDKNYGAYLKKLASTSNLSNKVFFRGRVTAEAMEFFYRDANIFLFPSRYEGYGMVLLEAMSYGLPIVATDIPTTRGVVKDGVNGYLCPVDDAYCMTKRIKRLLADNTLQFKISRINFRESRKFKDWKLVAKETFDTFAPYLLEK